MESVGFVADNVWRSQDADGEWKVRLLVPKRVEGLLPLWGEKEVRVAVVTTDGQQVVFDGTFAGRRENRKHGWTLTLVVPATESEAMEQLEFEGPVAVAVGLKR
jgi:hypothetical protein